QAHINILSKGHSTAIADYLRITKEVEQVPGVVFAAPALYQKVLLSCEAQANGVALKGIIPEMESRLSSLSHNMVEGKLNDFNDDSIIIGKELSKTLGSFLGDHLKAMSLGTRVTPLGLAPRTRVLQVTGIFESGL